MPDDTKQPQVLEDSYRKFDAARQITSAEKYDAEHHIDGDNIAAVEEDLILHTPPGQVPGATLPQNADLRAEDVDAAQFYGQEKPPLKEGVNS
jgi:hypothetical protein